MNDSKQNQLKGHLMDALVYYIDKEWGKDSKVTNVKIDEEKTFTDVLNPTFYEKREGNVGKDRANIPHTYGVLWSAEDISIDFGDDLSKDEEVSVFTKTYVNDTDAPIQISEKMEQGISVTDTCEIGFTEKINAGYEQSISIGVDLAGVKASAESKFSMGVELGSSQTTTKTVQETTTSGFSIEMEVPAKSTRTVTVAATKSSCNVLKEATFTPKGKAYAHVAYENDDVEQAHIYVFDLEEVAKYFDHLQAKDAPKFKFPIQYLLKASVHRDFHVQITSGNQVLSAYPMKER